jgi:hypothetical protein
LRGAEREELTDSHPAPRAVPARASRCFARDAAMLADFHENLIDLRTSRKTG